MQFQDTSHVEAAIIWLEKLVAMDTRNGSGDEIACINFLAAALRDNKPDTLHVQTVPRSRGKTDSAYVLATWGTPKVLLNVHIDTVPSGDGWTANPLQLRRDNNRLIGLGSSDIKGAAACILAALDHIKPQDVAILFSGDEEHGSEIMPVAIANGHTGGAAMAIVCEPTGCLPGRRHRGMLAYSAHASGPGGHSSLADTTQAPLFLLSQLAAAIGEYGVKNREFGHAPYKGLCVNIGDMTSDGSYNVIPTEADISFSMRPPPGDDVMQRAKAVQSLTTRISSDITLTQIVALHPFHSHDDAAFAPFFESYTPIDLPYWTEAALMSEAGMNVIVYGPGDVDQAHKPNEYVTTDHLATAMNVYGRALSGTYV